MYPSKVADEECQLMLHQQRAHIQQVLGVRRSSLLLALYVVFYLVYLITGGVVFAALEAPEEKAVISALVTARREFLETHPCVSGMLKHFLYGLVLCSTICITCFVPQGIRFMKHSG